MRIESQNPAPAPASLAQYVPAGGAAVFLGLLTGLGGGVSRSSEERAIGPEGAASRAHKQMTDPLGMATKQALVSPASSPLAELSRAGSTDPKADTPSPDDDGPPGPVRRAVERVPRGPAEPTGGAPARRDGGDKPGQPAGESTPARSVVSGPNPGGGGREPAPVGARGSGSGRVEAGRAVSARAGVPPARGGGPAEGFGGAPASVGRSSKPAVKPFASMLRHEKAEIAPQIAKGLASLLQRKGGRMQIRLNPEALGRVQVDLRIEAGVVRVRLDAEQEQARQLLGNELDRLRLMLERQGLRVERLEIVPHGPEARDGAGWRMPADEGFGTEADDGSRGGADRDGARGGDPHGRAERRQPLQRLNRAEPGAVRTDGVPLDGWSPVVVRLDTLA